MSMETTRVRDLRSALAAAAARGELVRVQREVDPGYEVPNVARSSSLQPQRPVLLFEHLRGFPGWRCATSLLADPPRLRTLCNLPTDAAELTQRLLTLFDQTVPPVVVERAPCQENVITGNLDLARLVPWTHGARHVTHRYWTGPVVSRDAETGKLNLALYRSCIQGPDTITVNGRWNQHLGMQISDAKRAGATIPVAVLLGTDPLMPAVATSKLPYGYDDFGLMGAIRGAPVELVRCKTIDLLVPANAEVVIEGEIRPPYERGDDGPWPEYLRYLGMNIHPPLVHVTAITHRHDPITYFTIPIGAGDHHGLLYPALLLRHLRQFASSFVADCTFAAGTILHHLIIKVRKSEAHHEGLQLNVALSAFGHAVEIDRVTLVDEDIDIYDPSQVNWAEATRCNPATQVHVLCEARTHQNNPIAGVREMFDEPIVRAKMIVDATIPWKYRVAEKGPGITFFTRSEWDAADLGQYFAAEDAARWVKRQPQGILRA